MKDYGFQENDKFYCFVDQEEREIAVHKHRDWFVDEEGEMDFHLTYFVSVDGKKELLLPKGTERRQAINVAHALYEEDEELTNELQEHLAEIESERRYFERAMQAGM